MKSFIIKKAEEIGIDQIRFTNAVALDKEIKFLQERVKENTFSWNIKNLDNKYNPSYVIPNAKTVIVCALNYYDNEQLEFEISPYTRSNYYLLLKNKLQQLVNKIKDNNHKEYHFYIQSCYGKLFEKAFAVKSGLGWYGKSGVLVTKEFGPFVILGLIVTDLYIEEDQPIKNLCGKCTKCIDICPTKALFKPFQVNNSKCIQYLSERLTVVDDELRNKWGKRLYGCSACLYICPFLGQKNKHNNNIGKIQTPIDLEKILYMTDDEFRDRFKDNQIGMRQKEAIQRNILLILGNSNSLKALSIIKKFLLLNDNKELKKIANWAFNKLLQLCYCIY